MSYENSRELFPLLQRGVEGVPPLNYESGLQYVPSEGQAGAIMRLWVKTRTSGSITDLKVWVPRLGVKTPAAIPAGDRFAMYTFAALAINAAGVYLFTISPGVADVLGNKKDGPFPPQFDIEVIQANPSDMVWQLDVMWL
jgi:hypothetical protein